MPNGRTRAAVAAAALALGLTGTVGLAACADDDEPAAPATSELATTTTVERAATSALTSAVTTAPASTGTAAVAPAVSELQHAVDAYDRAYALATAAPGDPSHVELLAATTDGDLRQGVQAAIADRRAAGQALRPGPAGVVLDQRIESVEAATDAEATVVTCLFNGSERYVVATDEVLDDSQVTWTNRVVLRRGDDGRWRVHAGERMGESRAVEQNPCA